MTACCPKLRAHGPPVDQFLARTRAHRRARPLSYVCSLPPRTLPAYDAAVYDDVGAGMCLDAKGRQFERFMKGGLPETECRNYCTRQPKCSGYYHLTSDHCNVLGPGLAQPAGWDTRMSGNGGVWPIAKASGTGATCYRKTGRFVRCAAHPHLLHGHACSNSATSCSRCA